MRTIGKIENVIIVIKCSVYGELDAFLIKIELTLSLPIMTRGNNPLKIKTTTLIKDNPLAKNDAQSWDAMAPHQAIKVKITNAIKMLQVVTGFLVKKSVVKNSKMTKTTSPASKTG